MTAYSRARDGRAARALAGVAGTLAALSSIGLLATSAWLTLPVRRSGPRCCT